MGRQADLYRKWKRAKGMIRDNNHLSYHEIIFDHHPLKVCRFGHGSGKRGTVTEGNG
jgi:hypothetical protein